jgi:hypothetical protein
MVRCVPPSPAGTTRRSPGAAQPTSTSLFAGRRATDGAVATAAAFAAAIAAVACCGGPHSRRAAGGARGRDMGLGVAQMVAQVPVVHVQRRRARWRALLECAEVVRVRARAGQVVPDAPGAELASGVSVGLGVAPVGALRWLYVASVISVRV